MADMPHMIRREQDECYCPRCNKRWGATEEPPGVCRDDRGDDRSKRRLPQG